MTSASPGCSAQRVLGNVALSILIGLKWKSSWGFQGLSSRASVKALATMRTKFETTKNLCLQQKCPVYFNIENMQKKNPVAQITDSLNFLLSDPILRTENAFMSQPQHIKGVLYIIVPYASDTFSARIPTYMSFHVSSSHPYTHTNIKRS